MPHAHRNAKGELIALHQARPLETRDEHGELTAQPATVQTAPDSPAGSKAYLAQTDVGLLRVVEDLVYLLMDKNVIMFTELPVAVQDKLKNRERARESLRQGELLVVDEDDIL